MDKLIIDRHLQQVSKADLVKTLHPYRKNLPSGETTSSIILLSELKNLIDKTEKEHGEGSVDGVRIYFCRPDDRREYIGPNQKIGKVGDQTQLSIIMVPMNKYNYSAPAIAYDMFDSDGNIWALTPGGEHTGLCPTNCGGSI